jgi:hypothetical protein
MFICNYARESIVVFLYIGISLINYDSKRDFNPLLEELLLERVCKTVCSSKFTRRFSKLIVP